MFLPTSFLLLLLVAYLADLTQATNEEGLAFLEANKEKEGVIVLPSGLQYKVLRKGDGVYHPTKNSPCSCHYAGTLIDGTTFDSSYDRGSPTTFAPNQVIAGWTEAMQLMVEGDKWEMYIPSDLAYGDRGSPPKIGGGEALIFTMEIIEIQGDKVPAMTCKVTMSEDLSSVKETSGCNEKESKYITKIGAWESTKYATELERLEKMKLGQMKPELLAWIERRAHILEQFTTPSQSAEDEEL